MAPARNICHKEAPANSARVCSVVSLDERDSRAPLRRQLSVDEERGCAGHWLPRQGGTDPDEGNTSTGQCPTGQGPTGPGAARGLRLYRAHLLRCLAAQGLRAPACAQMPVRADTGWWGWWWDTRALQMASRRFALSPQRAALRVRANSVQLAALDFPTFQHILQTLFQEGGASIERVLALFYFLSDLSCAALRSGLRAHFCRVTGWAARHVAECATPWVRRHGGWGRVVRGSAGQAAADVTALTALAAFCALASFCVYRMMRPQAIANC